MKFKIEEAIQILSQTPYTLQRMLDGLSPEWTGSGGDKENWAPYDVLGHLIHGEETDWIPRAELILAQGGDRNFVPFEMLGHFETSKGKALSDLLTEFGYARNASIEKLIRMQLTRDQLALTGIHPEFGEVTLEQHLSTWVIHDLGHIRQIVTYLAAKYEDNVGPWKAYLSILKK
jgi:hypothetical protein